jgi:Xaa-Pro aminopeptidase
MRTVQPSIVIGSYVWDQDRVPRDEFQARNAGLNRLMDENGWKAVLVYGDAVEHSALAWFSAFTTRLRWGMALLPREGDPRLLISMSSRDVPAMKLMTWIPDVHSGWNWESAFDPWLARFGEGPADFGTVGFELMRPPLYASLQKSLGNRFGLHAADDAVAAIRTLRPRERSIINRASDVVEVAASAFLESWRMGASVEAAALEGERTARMMAAQDVRTLVSFDGGRTLAPYRGDFPPPDAHANLAGYIAVKHMGYWVDDFVTGVKIRSAVLQQSRAALRSILERARPGATASELHATAMAALQPYALHPVLSGSVGRRIGFSLNEGGEIRGDSTHRLKPGEVYSLHAGAVDAATGGALVSAMIEIDEKSYTLLHLSPSADTR